MSATFGPTGCKECDRPAGAITVGNGKCNVCHGSGIANVYEAMASFAVAKETSNCNRCGGSGVCPRCGGVGEHY
jgi:DnaJ-class molecular chaperone